MQPEAASWHDDLGEFVLPYAAVAGAADPARALMDFLQTSYNAGAKALDFPAELTVPPGPVGQPPNLPDRT